jgi:hypothetical protein
MSARKTADELLINEIPKANATKALIEFPVSGLAGTKASGEWRRR